MNEPIFGLLLLATLSLLDSFFPTWSAFEKRILQHDLACCLSMLPLKFQGTWMVPSSYSIPFSRNRHLKKTQTEFQYFVHLLEMFLNIFANQRKEESLATPFFCKAYIPFGAPFGAQQWKFPSSLSIFVAFLY